MVFASTMIQTGPSREQFYNVSDANLALIELYLQTYYSIMLLRIQVLLVMANEVFIEFLFLRLII